MERCHLLLGIRPWFCSSFLKALLCGCSDRAGRGKMQWKFKFLTFFMCVFHEILSIDVNSIRLCIWGKSMNFPQKIQGAIKMINI